MAYLQRQDETTVIEEVDDLRSRLHEAEQIIDAIRNGYVDAFVVQDAAGDRIRTLHGSDPSYRLLIEEMSEGAAIISSDGIFRYCNSYLTKLLGLPLSALVGHSIYSFIVERDRAKAIVILETDNIEEVKAELEIVDIFKKRIPVYFSVKKAHIDGVNVSAIVVTDLSQQQRDSKLLTEGRLARQILEQVGEAIVVCDAEGTIIDANRIARLLVGESVLGQHLDDRFMFYHEKKRLKFFSPLIITNSNNASLGQEFLCQKGLELCLHGDDLKHVIVKVGSLDQGRVKGGLGWVFTISDITQRKLSEEKITYLAHHDSLTNLPNRTLFIDRLERAIAHCKRTSVGLAVLFLDLDRFKYINDSLGHHIGDQLLAQVSRVLQQHVRENDTVARFGGDEFVVLLNELKEPNDAVKVTNQILEAISEEIVIDGHQLYVSASLGIAIYPDDGENSTDLLKRADVAMYCSKNAGRNCFSFYSTEGDTLADRVALANELREAIKNGELEVLYQPQIAIHSGEVVAAEALLRWNHNTQGTLLPAEFIHIAEESGLISDIGLWVVRTVCKQLSVWEVEGLNKIRVAINLSPSQLRNREFPKLVNSILKEENVSPAQLEFELTENMVMVDQDQVFQVLKELAQLGISLSIDDYGTGYSSLSHLKHFPVNKIKIDKSFLENIEHDPRNIAITQAIISMCQGLNLAVIAEGVENEGQMQYLKDVNCTHAQGFLIRRPINSEEFGHVLSNGFLHA